MGTSVQQVTPAVAVSVAEVDKSGMPQARTAPRKKEVIPDETQA
jgi:hypothetical protein